MPTARIPSVGNDGAIATPSAEKAPAAPRTSRGTKRLAENAPLPANPALAATALVPPAVVPVAAKRKRLSKAFSRPLDKALRKKSALVVAPEKQEPVTVRDGFTFSKDEHEHLVRIKKELAEQGVTVKKSELIRVALMLLRACPQGTLKGLLAKLPKIQ